MKTLIVLIGLLAIAGCDHGKNVTGDSTSNVQPISEDVTVIDDVEYSQIETECVNGEYQTITYIDGEIDSQVSKPCNSYVPHAVEPITYRLTDEGDYIKLRADMRSIGTHCSYGDITFTADGIEGYDYTDKGINTCEYPDVDISLPSLSDELVKYSVVIEFNGYNGEYQRKYISVDAWRVE